MPFYAYVIPSSTANNTNEWRYQVTFASRDVADQWWRAIQKAVDDKVPKWDSVKRITPQLYTHNPWIINIIQSVLDSKVASNLSDQTFFLLLYNRDNFSNGNLIATEAITDHRNDRTYTIRSQRDPSLYWYINSERNVVLSRDDIPTRFLIRLRNPLPYPNPILIGSDDVILQVPTARGGNYVSTNNNSALNLSERPDVFKFADFTDSFERVGSVETDSRGKAKYVYIFKNDTNNGEAWELA